MCTKRYKSDSDTGAGLSEEQLKQLFSDGVQFNVNQLQAGAVAGFVYRQGHR
jgi:hypothetical protein